MDEYKYDGCEIAVQTLDRDVIAVAKQGYRKDDWAAYVGCPVCIRKENPEYMNKLTSKPITEMQDPEVVILFGSKLLYSRAAIMFPSFNEKYGWSM